MKVGRYDIIIVGAGPAGATLARLLGGRLRVLLIDRRTFGPDRPQTPKCCAGLLSPRACRALAALRLVVPPEARAEPRTAALRAFDLDTRRERLLPQSYLNVDRDRFDRWLVSRVGRGVEKSFGSLVSLCRRTSQGAEVRFRDRAGRPRRARAALVVGADGAGSLVRRQMFPGRLLHPPYVAVQEWHPCPRPVPAASLFLDRRTTDHCGWAIPKSGELVVGAALPPGPGAARRFAGFKRRLRRAGLDLGWPARRSGALFCRTGRGEDLLLGDDSCALAGEAAGLVRSSDGIGYALTSAALLAAALKDGLDGCSARYRRLSRRLLASLGASPAGLTASAR